jgi:transcriptional regulator with XRE-family HTH domain
LRLAKGLSQVDLARLVGRHQTVIGPYERDEYEPPRDVIEKLARVLDTSPEYLYFGRSPQRSAVPVAGRVGMLGLLEPQGDGPEELLMLRDDQLLAFRIGDDSMAPVFRPGQIVLVGTAEVGASEQVGRDALVELADGRTLLRRLAPSAAPDRFDLAAYNAPTVIGAAVVAVRPVLGTLWSGAFAEAGDGAAR